MKNNCGNHGENSTTPLIEMQDQVRSALLPSEVDSCNMGSASSSQRKLLSASNSRGAASKEHPPMKPEVVITEEHEKILQQLI